MSLNPIIRINVREEHFCKTTDKTECFFVTLCCKFTFVEVFFVLLQHFVYALVKFKSKKHLVRVRKTSWVGLK